MKKVFMMIIVVMMVSVMSLNVFAINSPVLTDPGYDPNVVPNGVKEKTGNIWSTVAFVVRILSVGCVVFAGLRYMFASANQKADIKQGLIYLAIGAAFIFASISIIELVVGATTDIL